MPHEQIEDSYHGEANFVHALTNARKLACSDARYAPSTSDVKGMNWANDEIGRLRAKVERLTTLADGLNEAAKVAFLDGRKNAEAEWQELERSYTHQLGEMARLCDTVCTFVLGHGNLDEESPEVKSAAEEIMEYVEAVRP